MKKNLVQPIMTVVNTIATHHKPDPDEEFAIFLLRQFGEELFPGVSQAPIAYWDAGPSTPDGRTSLEWEAEGVLQVGVGGGRFDEHPKTGPRDQRECSATLVAQCLHVDQLQAFKPFLRHIWENDNYGHHKKNTQLCGLIKLWNDNLDPSEARYMAQTTLECYFEEELRFQKVTAVEYPEVAQVHTCNYRGSQITVVSGETDNEQFVRCARSPYGHRADVVVQRLSSGNVIICTRRINEQRGQRPVDPRDQRPQIDLSEVVALIRDEEQVQRRTALTKDPKVLRQGNSVPGAEMWHYDLDQEALLNGGKKAPNAEPTKLSLDDVLYCVLFGLDETRFARQHAKECQAGRCSASATGAVCMVCSWSAARPSGRTRWCALPLTR